MSISEKHVLTAGGAGFRGSHRCERRLVHGNHVPCVDNTFCSARTAVGRRTDDTPVEPLRHDGTAPPFVEVDATFNRSGHPLRDGVARTRSGFDHVLAFHSR